MVVELNSTSAVQTADASLLDLERRAQPTVLMCWQCALAACVRVSNRKRNATIVAGTVISAGFSPPERQTA